ncbi:MAG: glycosyltransferase family 4 protein [Chloroflexi bacterium]|nr:glycosyltransferase family 4 protein [Chloroflexota bacterium]
MIGEDGRNYPMKILFVTESYAPAGGAERYVLELQSLLEAQAYESAVIYHSTHPRMLATKGKPIYHIPLNEKSSSTRPRITDIIQAEKPTLIYFHTVNDSSLVTEASQLAPTIAYVHNFQPVCPALAKYFRIGDNICTRPFGLGCLPAIYLRRCAHARHPRSVYQIMQNTRNLIITFRSFQHVVVASSYMRQLMVQQGFDPYHITVLPPHFEKSHPLKPPEINPPIVLFVGRVEIEKGLPYLLQAMTQVQTPFRLLIAGDGTRRPEYEALAQQYQLGERVQFLGWLDEHKLGEAYTKASLLVMPGIWPEPFGKVGIEALSRGRPVVAFNGGGISDWLQDGWNGFLVPPKDTESLARRIETLLDDPDLATQLGVNGRQFVQKTYTTEQHLEKFLSICQQVLSS